jgi:PilZ domain
MEGEPMGNKQPTSTWLSGNASIDETTDRRTEPRFPVQFRTVLSVSGTTIEGRGTILDLSLKGCRVEAPLDIQPSILLELRIYIPDLDWPLMVDGAVVQWVKGQTFGLRFLRLRKSEEERLAEVISCLENDEDSPSKRI